MYDNVINQMYICVLTDLKLFLDGGGLCSLCPT